MKFSILSFIVLLCTYANANEITVYSTRKEQLLEPVIKAYEAKSGNKVKVVYDAEGPLMERLKREGSKSQADILLAVDAGNLWLAAEQGLLDKTKSPILEKNVPAALRDPEGQWFAVTRRVRAIVYNPKAVQVGDLVSYEDLAHPKWKGKLCLRSSSKVYNQSLVAMMIERLGEEKAKDVVQGWVNNLGTKVFSDDTSLIKAIQTGPCQVGIVNSYYLGNLIKKEPNTTVKIFWPNQDTSGAHVNISGAGITKSSKNKAEARKFIEWMVSAEGQQLLSDMNLEFPIQDSLFKNLNPILKGFGSFKSDTMNLSTAGRRQRQAVMLMDSVGYK